MRAREVNLCHSCGFVCGKVLRASLLFFLYTCTSLPHLCVRAHEFSCAAWCSGAFGKWLRYALWSCFPSNTSPFGQQPMPASAAHSCSCPGLDDQLSQGWPWLHGWCSPSHSINPMCAVDREEKIKEKTTWSLLQGSLLKQTQSVMRV